MVVPANMVAWSIMGLPIWPVENARAEQIHWTGIVIIPVATRVIVDPLIVVSRIMRMPAIVIHIPVPMYVPVVADMAPCVVIIAIMTAV